MAPYVFMVLIVLGTLIFAPAYVTYVLGAMLFVLLERFIEWFFDLGKRNKK